jgi:hypothetical protein
LLRDGGSSPAVLTKAPIPPLWNERSIEEQIDWLVEHHFPMFIRWIEDWVEAADDLAIDVLFTQLLAPKVYPIREASIFFNSGAAGSMNGAGL